MEKGRNILLLRPYVHAATGNAVTSERLTRVLSSCGCNVKVSSPEDLPHERDESIANWVIVFSPLIFE